MVTLARIPIKDKKNHILSDWSVETTQFKSAFYFKNIAASFQ